MISHLQADPSDRSVAWVRIPLGAWMCLLCLYVVMSCVGRGFCDGLITSPEESYRVSVCVWSRNPEKGGQTSVLDYKRLWMNEPFPGGGGGKGDTRRNVIAQKK
jgi:hypothetical protein